jgi:predicted O-methyltransferase YrrM
LADLAGADTIDEAGGLVGRLDRVRWNVRLDEQFALGVLIRRVRPRRLFEIGTFDGDTTRYLARVAGGDAHIWTLDYPPDEFDRVNHLAGFSGGDIGRAFRGMPEASRITQLSGDSGTFDFSPYAASMDVVFVDATHNYALGLRDSATALKLARPGGWVIWHDYWTQWPGLVRAIREVATERDGLALFRVAGMRLALVQAGVASQARVRAALGGPLTT